MSIRLLIVLRTDDDMSMVDAARQLGGTDVAVWPAPRRSGVVGSRSPRGSPGAAG
jgi:hypothetical protein